MTGRDVVLTIRVTRAEYRALESLARANNTQAHILVERVVTGSLGSRVTEPQPSEPRPVQPKRSRERKRALPDDLALRVKEAHARGLNDREIAAELGCTRDKVRTRREFLGLPGVCRGRPTKRQTINDSRRTAA